MTDRTNPHLTLVGTKSIADGSDEAAQTTLLVVGSNLVQTHAVTGTRTLTLGRDESCDISLDHARISRRHAEIHIAQDITVLDLGSTNGVRVGGQRIEPDRPHVLAPGDSFSVGPFTVVVFRGSQRLGQTSEDARAALVVVDPTPEGVPEVVKRLARSPVSVVIHGETGTGKEVLANTLHVLSERTGPMVAINCAALGETLLESELFGHEQGAFTGAVRAKPGLLESAARGTVFLDEIAEMPLAVQAKLLRAIETRQVTRVGSVRPIALDVRFLAASHRHLPKAVAAGTFRQDLYYRLNGLTLSIPPLRARPEAIAVLATLFVEEGGKRGAGTRPSLHPDALALLQRQPFPGNVRELKTVIERALLLCEGDVILPRHILVEPPEAPAAPAAAAASAPGARDAGTGDEEERARLVAALEACAGNQTRAAKMLGLARSTFTAKLLQYRIPRPRGR